MDPDAVGLAANAIGHDPKAFSQPGAIFFETQQLQRPPGQRQQQRQGQQQAINDIHEGLAILCATCVSCENIRASPIIRTMKTRNIPAWLLLGTLACSAAIAGDKGFTPPPAKHAATYSLHESHDDESVSIALDPYDTPDKTALFKVRYRDSGLMPIRFIIS